MANDSHTSSANDQISFPLRVACVDMGSNAIRFLAAEFGEEGEFTALESRRCPVRLGHSVFLSGVLDSHAMDEAVAALVEFKDQMRGFDIQHCRAVATSAVREAANSDTFIDRVLMATGLEVSVISVTEEGRLTVLAARDAVGEGLLNRGKAVVAEVGGGSTILNLMESGEITASPA